MENKSMEKTIIEGGIIAGNKLIAEFMGGKLKYFNITNLPYYQMPDKQRWMPERLVYHSDWSSLMPVVEKIMSLGFRVEALFSSVDNSVHITDGEERLNIVSYSDPKQCIYTAVIQFISWYNSQGVKPAK